MRKTLQLPRKCWLYRDDHIIYLIAVILWTNQKWLPLTTIFDCNREHYHWVSDRVMSTKLEPAYAILLMTRFERQLVYTYPIQPKLWKKFIDDIFLMWPPWTQYHKAVHCPFNTVHPISSSSVPFLHNIYPVLTLWYTSKKLNYLLDCTLKLTDRHIYLNCIAQMIPQLGKTFIPYSQFLRLKKINSELQYVLETKIHRFFYYLWRDYLHDMIQQAWEQSIKVPRENF